METINYSEEINDRFSRFKLINWWDQKKLQEAKVLVIGAGALGNEILKNLALLGIGNVLVVDMDKIENSNLSRSVLYRASDNGKYKATTAAEVVSEIYPEMKIKGLNVNAVYDLGLGVYHWADLIIGGLDNREARYTINQNSHLMGKPWFDGAIEAMQGVARGFMPGDSPCYECTMSKIDWEMLQKRRSCTLLSRDEMLFGKTPTTPTISSIISAVLSHEAVKYIHGMETLSGEGFVFNGLTNDSYIIEYTRKKDCMSHEEIGPVIEKNWSGTSTSLKEILEEIKSELGEEAIIELNNEILVNFKCLKCNKIKEEFSSLGTIKEKQGKCSECGEWYELETIHSIYGSENFLHRTPAEIGVPLFDIITGRNGMNEKYYLLNQDKNSVIPV